MNQLLLSYYGDDFTGSTDAMEALTLGGIPTALFLEPPTPAFLAEHFPQLRAVGVAGIGRSLSPEQMEEALPPIFDGLRALNAPLNHYKVCSTFDSSPTVGSIGRALDLGVRIFESAYVPVVVGSPALKRYVSFGNLFASVRGTTYRLDRHPTMSKHPITPMGESDLRLHLGKQTARSIGLIDLLQLAQPTAELEEQLHALLESGIEAVVFDTLNDNDLLTIGRLLWAGGQAKPLFIVGSSGVEYAVAAWQRAADPATAAPQLTPPGSVDQLLVMSGSASPVTAEQISWAEDHGFQSIRLPVGQLLNPATAEAAREELAAQALSALATGASVLLYTARGPDDPALTEQTPNATGERLGQQIGTMQGALLRRILDQTALTRICVAGGDTCGYVIKQLGIYAMSMRYPLAPGGPLCRAYSSLPHRNGLELSLKGGQVGQADYFGRVRAGQ